MNKQESTVRRNQRIIQLRRAGTSYREIQKETGLGYSALKSICNGKGTDKEQDPRRKEILRLYQVEGYTNTEIAKIMGVSRQRISQITCAVLPRTPSRKKEQEYKLFQVIQREYNKGKAFCHIAKEQDLSVNMILRIAHQHGLKSDPKRIYTTACRLDHQEKVLERNRMIIQDYLQKDPVIPVQDIARKHKTSKEHVYRIVSLSGAKRRPQTLRRQKPLQARNRRILRSYQKGTPVRKIAQQHDLSKNHVYLILRLAQQAQQAQQEQETT